MKPHGAYQQLKLLHSPEQAPFVEQPTGLLPPKGLRCILVTAILPTMLVAALLLYLLLPPFHGASSVHGGVATPFQDSRCSDPCRAVLVESVPEGLIYDDNSTLCPSIFEAWQKLLGDASSTVDIASFYWSLTNEDTHTHDPSASQGEDILAQLSDVPSKGVTLRIAVNPPSHRMPNFNLRLLEERGAQVRTINLPQLTSGVLHTKFWIVDQKHVYLGSANMDWRALTQVKELGVVIYNCSCLAADLGKMFGIYWDLGLPNATIPAPWPAKYTTTFNKEMPLQLTLNGTDAGVYFSSAPPALCATGRTEDLQALLGVIEGAEEFVYIAVMSYLPTMEFSHPKRFWPVIDDHLRKAAYERNVRIRLLIGCWKHSKPDMFPFLRSLAAMQDNRTQNSVEVRLFVVPANETQARIPYARVNHSKFMVTDKVAYIGTSNWSGDYFVHTAGSALVVNQSQAGPGEQPTVQEQLRALFERDWSSRYSLDLRSPGQWEDLCRAY